MRLRDAIAHALRTGLGFARIGARVAYCFGFIEDAPNAGQVTDTLQGFLREYPDLNGGEWEMRQRCSGDVTIPNGRDA